MATTPTEAAAPTLTLTPPDPVPVIPVEKAVGLVPVAPEHKSKLEEKVDAFVAALEFHGFLDGHRVAAVNDGARRNLADDALAGFPGFAAARAVFAVVGDELGIVVVGAEIVGRGIDHEDDIATRAAVTAVWSATGDKLLPAPGNNAVSPVACFGENSDVVNKHGRTVATRTRAVNGNGACAGDFMRTCRPIFLPGSAGSASLRA